MADGITYRTEKTSKRKFGFLAGLVLGLILGWLAGNYSGDSNKTSQSNLNGSSSSQTSRSSQTAGLVPREQQASLQTRLIQYSQLLVEAARENIDAPSDEATASKAALDQSTASLLEALGVSNSSPLRSDVETLNNEVVAYAATVKSGGETAAVNEAYGRVVNSLKNEYTVTNVKEFETAAENVKSSLTESIQAFANQDYIGSYAKQLEAESNIRNVFALLLKQ